jgi:uncharacterized cupin superfamily protein/ketosteroid isomerase-like protein
MRRINIAETSLSYDPIDPEGFRAGLFHIGREVGAEQTGTTVYEIPPGEALCPYHYEYGEEEWLLVVEGRPSVRTPEGIEQLERLDLVFFPKGPDGAHQVRNDTGTPALVLMWSNVVYPTATAYPDSDKVGLYTGDENEDLMAPRSSNVGYYHGESHSSGGVLVDGETANQNLAVVRKAAEAFGNADMEAVADNYSPDATISAVPEGWPEPAPFEGREAVTRQFRRLVEDWQSQSMEILREAADGDWAVLELRWSTRGAGSGVSLATAVTGAYRLEDGKIAEARFFWDWEQALADVRARAS